MTTTPTDSVERMEAGRALDALVAERVMGWHARDAWYDADDNWMADLEDNFPIDAEAFSPSTSIEAAWQVVEKMRGRGWTMTLNQEAEMQFEPWDCRFFGPNDRRAIAHGNTAPLAICRAALKAMEATR